MNEWCAISCWEWHAGQVRTHLRLKRRGPETLAFVREAVAMRMLDIKIDTENDGVFRIETHDREFYEWCCKDGRS